MRYAVSRILKEEREMAYRIYVSDALKAISESTSKENGGPYMTARLIEIMHPKKQENKTGNEIAADIIKKIRGEAADGFI